MPDPVQISPTHASKLYSRLCVIIGCTLIVGSFVMFLCGIFLEEFLPAVLSLPVFILGLGVALSSICVGRGGGPGH